MVFVLYICKKMLVNLFYIGGTETVDVLKQMAHGRF